MAEALYLVQVAAPEAAHRDLIDGIHVVLVNADDGSTDAEIIADAEARVVLAGHDIPSSYFDTVVAIGDLTSGPLPDDTDCMILGPRWVEIELAP